MSVRFAVLAFLLLAGPALAADPPRPNVVFILADDLGYTDVACFGSKYYETPNIDRLAAQGLRYTHGYTCGPNCQPTRAALMTGQYGPRTGIYTVGSTDRFDTTSRPLVPVPNVVDLDLAKTTVAESMKKAGYATAMFGKWHLGQRDGYHPSQQGFDEAIVSAGKHFNFNTSPKVDVPEGAYLADFLTDKAVDFIERNRTKPFFLYLPHYGVHSPYQAKEDIIARFKDKAAVGGHHDPTYAAMIASVDESVGRVVAKIDELGLGKNTLIIFSSDNGGVGGYSRAGVFKNTGKGEITDNAPLRGGKGMLYEGGVRVPWVVRWTDTIKPGSASTQPILSVDLHPTLLELSGGVAPDNQPLDGVSLVASLKSGGEKPLGREDLFWHFPGYLGAAGNSWRTTPASAIRHGDYKLIEFFEDGRLELYDVVKDAGQEKDLAKEKPDMVKDLHARLVAWRESVNAPIPEKRDDSTKAPAAPKKKGKGKKAAKAA
ncbi:Arylsulfatase [Caulifigura coniformis]|uniref:Arylsulfatase n=1 Tax=Caulifigura coniformis TaxID=2527983 RepID=A0A517SJT2_9PLAN|nr:sulfatase [Caulifigura coniformis]QDT56377.1 Arylsulfatase [Caulifigura coniformis]